MKTSEMLKWYEEQVEKGLPENQIEIEFDEMILKLSAKK